MASVDQIRKAQQATWAKLSVGWEKWDSVISDQLAPVGAAIIESLDITSRQQHLDIAAGTGEPGLTIARLAPAGHVVLTDLAPEMLEVAARRVAQLGVTNVETVACSADDLPFDDATFDSVSIRFGFMFFPDLGAAAAESARVLKPGGRVSSSVWIKPEANPWTSIVMQAIATEISVAPIDATRPNMFRCAAPGYVSGLYRSAGLIDIAEWEVATELVTESPQHYWEVVSEHISPAVTALEGIDDRTRARIAVRVVDAVSEFAVGGKIRTPGSARCIVGTKPAG